MSYIDFLQDDLCDAETDYVTLLILFTEALHSKDGDKRKKLMFVAESCDKLKEIIKKILTEDK